MPGGSATREAPAADRKGAGLAPPAVSVPTGGGAIRGIGEKFAVNPVSGTASLTVPIVTSEGRGGFGPQLALRYDSGAGNGPFGFGWHLDLPAITRQTDKGLPRYTDADVFVLSGAEDLVPGAGPDVVRDGFAVRRYRPRIEGAFTRIERWTRQSDGDTHWRTIARDNVLTVYGSDADSRIADPDDPRRVFGWLVCARYDDRGNAAVFSYAAEDASQVDGSAAHEAHRTREANRYPKRIRYGNRKPLLLDTGVDGMRRSHVPAPDFSTAGWMFEVVFDYGEGHREAQLPDVDGRVLVEASPVADGTWPVRRDAFSRYRSGFEVRTYRLCRGVLVFHHFADELGTPDCLVRATRFSYDEKPVGSFLREVVQSGYVRRQDGRYLERSQPALTFGYTTSPLEGPDYTGYEVRDLDGVDAADHRFVDLDGEGIAGALTEAEGAWFYRPNLGDGRLGPVRPVARIPALAGAAGRSRQLVDLDGDGALDFADLGPDGAGFYERTGDGGWAPLRAFASWPRLRWDSGSVRLADLTGDGLADLLVAGDDGLGWHPSLGADGFAAAVRVGAPADDERGPRVVFADAAQSIHLADLSGDGLADLVRVRDGEVCYWPNLGYGRFGAKVTMDNAPRFGAPDLFDPARIRLADTDGSGTADIVYLGADGVRVHLNESGNRWSDARVLPAFPAAHSRAAVTVVDLLGRGTACLVWSSPLPGDARRPVRYVDLMAGRKPHLLNRVRNNLGAETVLEYASSTSYQLADKAAGRPWATRLPFPVHVVSRVDTYDHIGRNHFVSRYSYHHGYYDGVEREWRGFGRVDQLDTAQFAVLTGDGRLPAQSTVDASHVPPVLTKSWYHTGAYLDGREIARHLAAEYHGEPLGPADSALPPGLTAGQSREACRALKGLLLRREVYAQDGTEAADRPYACTGRAYAVRPLGPRVFLPHPRESVEAHGERRPSTVDSDPRVVHELTLDVDDYGTVLRSASVAYGRRHPDPDPRLTDADRAVQARTLVTFTVNAVTPPVSSAHTWRTPLPAGSDVYELVGAAPAGRLFTVDELRGRLDAASDGAHDLPFADYTGQGATGGVPYRRLVDAERTRYRRNDLTGPCAAGQAESLALPHDRYRLAFTPELAASAYAGRLTPAEVDQALTEGGHVHLPPEPGWWAPSTRVFYSADPTDPPATELAEAGAHFFRERSYVDPFGSPTTVRYDAHDLLVTGTRDALDNVVAAANDYRVLRAATVTDPNLNRRAVAFDALGQVVGTAVMGRSGAHLGDSLDGFVADLTDAQTAAHLADPLADPRGLLGRASTRLVYDLDAFARTGTRPSAVSTLARVTHDSDPGGQATDVHCVLSYSDGFGQEVQRKRPDGPDRWVASGWTVHDGRGRAVRTYEPFFDPGPEFTFGYALGVGPIRCHDPLDRVVAEVHPHHAWQKTVAEPWAQHRWDVNDTALVADPAADPDVGNHLRRLPPADYLPTWYAARAGGALGPAQQDAATKTAAHAGTPLLAALDPLGRVFAEVAHNRVDGADTYAATRTAFDVQGRQRAVVDALGRVVLRTDVDLLGNRIVAASMEAGVRRWLYDVTGAPVRRFDARGHAFRWEYDELRRPVRRTVRGSDPNRSDPRTLGRDVVYERVEYGEGQPNEVARNLRTRMVATYDGAGVDGVEEYDFTGNARHRTRQYTVDHQALPDWAGNPALETDVWHDRATFDALGRPATVTTADGSVAYLAYTPRGLPDAVDVRIRGAATHSPFVVSTVYNAGGQRTRVEFGNGAATAWEYDPATFRPVRLTTTRPAAGDALASTLFADATRVQDLAYAYDPAGNPTRVADAALRTVFHDNAQVEPVYPYTYDALYRLIQAGGREHVDQSAMTGASPRDHPFAGAGRLTDPQAVRAYTERYAYDGAGNLTSVAHTASGGGWTRTYAYSEPSLLDAGAVSNRLSHTATGAGTEPYGYDAHGCLRDLPHLSLLEWDFKGQVRASARQVVNEGAPETTYYGYAADGRRARKVTERAGGGRRAGRLYLRGGELYREYAGDATTVTRTRETLYATSGTKRVALVETLTVDSGQSIVDPVPLVRYQVGTHLDSVALELDGAGGVISNEEYTPYGSPAFQAGRSAAEVNLKRYRYTGRERDEETGFAYHGARYYAPWLGRWISCDPAGLADGPNLYQYARSNPCRLADPGGTQARDEEGHRVPGSPGTQVQERAASDANAAPDGRAASADGKAGAPPDARPPPDATQGTAAEPKKDAPFAHVHIGPGWHGVTKVEWRNWTQRTWLSWVSVVLFLGIVGTLVFGASRSSPKDPVWLKALRLFATMTLVFMVVRALIYDSIDEKKHPGEPPAGDLKPADWRWTPIHTMAGVVMGLWHVPFPIVAGATALWEVFEISVPGYGDHEINLNRAVDIGVAWTGWATAAGLTSWGAGLEFPHGFSGRHYTEDRPYGKPLKDWF